MRRCDARKIPGRGWDSRGASGERDIFGWPCPNSGVGFRISGDGGAAVSRPHARAGARRLFLPYAIGRRARRGLPARRTWRCSRAVGWWGRRVGFWEGYFGGPRASLWARPSSAARCRCYRIVVSRSAPCRFATHLGDPHIDLGPPRGPNIHCATGAASGAVAAGRVCGEAAPLIIRPRNPH